jgi:hypothetical protein
VALRHLLHEQRERQAAPDERANGADVGAAVHDVQRHAEPAQQGLVQVGGRLDVEQRPGLFFEVGDVHGPLPGERVVRGDGHPVPPLAQQHGAHLRVSLRLVDEAQIDLPAQHPLLDLRPRALDDLQANPRVPAGHELGHLRDHDGRERRETADGVGPRLGRLVRRAHEVADRAEQCAAAGGDLAAGLGQVDALGLAPDRELHAEHGLQLLQRLADRRLRHVALERGPGDRLLLGDGDEVLQLPQRDVLHKQRLGVRAEEPDLHVDPSVAP